MFKKNNTNEEIKVDRIVISVVMPVYNGELYLREAIESILNQTYSHFELIIVNDGSTDRTKEIIHSFKDSRIVYVENEENLKIVKTLNRGLNLSKGKFIARMDADDIAVEDRFEKQVDYLRTNEECDVLGTWYYQLDRNESVIGQVCQEADPLVLKWELLFGNRIGHPTTMMRKIIFEDLQGYDENLIPEGKFYVEDYDLWCRANEKHRIHILPEILLYHRTREEEPPALFYPDGNKSPTGEIAVRNLERLMGEGNSKEKYYFLYKVLGEGQLPKDRKVLKKTLPILRDAMISFFNKYNHEKAYPKIKKAIVSRLLIYISPAYSWKYCSDIFLFLLKLDFIQTIKLTIKKFLKRFSLKRLTYG